MKVNYNITENHTIVISFRPEKDCMNGLVIQHGEVDEVNGQPAITRDLDKYVSEYPLPPDFDPSTIVQVDVDENAGYPGSVIPKW